MTRRRLTQAILLCCALALLSGCVYLRLLRFKHQLNDFDANVVVDHSQGLSLKFPSPIVLDEDFIFITESRPTRIHLVKDAPEVEVWDWQFEKKRKNGSDLPFHITFATRFEDGLLTEISFDPQLLEAIPAEFIVELFRSLGDAKINKFRKSATAALNRDSLEGVTLPSMAEISTLMGKPTRKKSEGKRSSFNYVFNFYNPQSQDLSGQFAIVFKTDSPNMDREIAGFELTGKGR